MLKLPPKPDEKVKKEITLGGTEIKVEKAEEGEVKRPRGRPKGYSPKGKKAAEKAEKVTWEKAKSSPLGKALDELIMNVCNKKLLADCEKLEVEEVQIGSALVYTVAYYGLPADHPAMVIVGASLLLGASIMNKRQKKIKKPKKAEG